MDLQSPQYLQLLYKQTSSNSLQAVTRRLTVQPLQIKVHKNRRGSHRNGKNCSPRALSREHCTIPDFLFSSFSVFGLLLRTSTNVPIPSEFQTSIQERVRMWIHLCASKIKLLFPVHPLSWWSCGSSKSSIFYSTLQTENN